MGLINYIFSIIISTILYLRIKVDEGIELTEEEKSAMKTIIAIPYFNTILMMIVFVNYFDIWEDYNDDS